MCGSVGRRFRFAAITALGGCLPATAVLADDPTGYFIGGGIGAADVNQGFFDIDGGFHAPEKHRVGWKAFAGVRPSPYFGAQIEYVDFGQARLGPNQFPLNGVPGGPFGIYGSRSYARAGGAFAVGYLPIGPQWLDTYAKLGAARIWDGLKYSENASNVFLGGSSTPLGDISVSQSNARMGVGYGVGVQAHLGAFALQLEYERFSASHIDPSLLALNLTWKFQP